MKLLAALFDLGDVLIQEETIEREARSVRAQLMPGMDRVLARLCARGVKLGVVSNSQPGFFSQVLGALGLYHLFDAFAVSGVHGYQKPDPRLFRVALERMGVLPQDYSRTLMIGDILEKDIVGANAAGLVSVWFHWNDRYRGVIETEAERPRYAVRSIRELDVLLDQLLP